MSLKSKIDELQAELQAANDLVVAREAQLAVAGESIETLTAAASQASEKHAAELASLTEERDAHLAQTFEQAERIQAIEAQLAAANDELTAAKQALANPAYADAAIVGGEPVQDVDGSEEPAKSALEQFESITDPQAQRDFYKANKAAIQAELKRG